MLSVSVVIPHTRGARLLEECLASLSKSIRKPFETILVLNGPAADDFDRNAIDPALSVQILRYSEPMGFAAACNRGVEAAGGELVFLLNDDAVVAPDTLAGLAEIIEQHSNVAACQPKLLSLLHPGFFDYASAAGGELDRWGIPFARGRVFDAIERDFGQYDDLCQVFWGAAAALMIRRDLYLSAGGLNEWFWAHMEEIDLLWRLQLMGWRVMAAGGSVAYHRGAATIRSDSWRKAYLNHRNSLAMMVRNYSAGSLLRYLPGRLLMDAAAALKSLLALDFVRLWAVAWAQVSFFLALPSLLKSRKSVQGLRKVSDDIILGKLYPRPVVWQFFIKGRRTWAELYNARQ